MLMDLIARYRKEIFCAGLLLLMGFNLLSVVRHKSLTNDEYYHIPAGYYHLSQGNFKLNEEHPPLVKMWAALPLLLDRPLTSPPTAAAAENPISRGHETFAQFWTRIWQGPNYCFPHSRTDDLTHAGSRRLIFVYARELFGSARAGSRFCFSVSSRRFWPMARVQTDLPAALAYLVFLFSLAEFPAHARP